LAKFKNLPTEYRLTQRNDAEKVFEEWAGQHGISFSRFGFDSPPFTHFPYIPAPLRKTADYIGESSPKKFEHLKNRKGYKSRHALIEVKGIGKDQVLKLKAEDINELTKAQKFFETPVTYFIWDQYRRRVTIDLSLDRALKLIEDAERGYFDDGPKRKMYYMIPADTNVIEWKPFEPATLES
jgi:hypothetical protein